jgi:hypothetical protein
VYVDDVNIVVDNTDTIKQNTGTLLDASIEVGLDENPQKTRNMLTSRYQKAGQNHSIKIAKRSFEDVAKYKYLVTTLPDQNFIKKVIKKIPNFENACYNSVQVFCLPTCSLGM